LFGYVDCAYERLGNAREPTEAREYERAMGVLRKRLSADELTANVRTGAVLSGQQAEHEALLT
jgi:hypothetical protein